MKWTILIVLFMMSFLTYGQEKTVAGFDPKTDVIADNYEAGAYLIYDCVEKHWTCVMEEFYTECKEKRVRDLASDENEIVSCAPVGTFPNKRSCFQRQLFMTTHNHGQRFCINEKWIGKAIEY